MAIIFFIEVESLMLLESKARVKVFRWSNFYIPSSKGFNFDMEFELSINFSSSNWVKMLKLVENLYKAGGGIWVDDNYNWKLINFSYWFLISVVNDSIDLASKVFYSKFS